MTLASRVAGAVLTGGNSRRFGRPKAVEPVSGVPMAAVVARALAAGGCGSVMLVGGERRRFGELTALDATLRVVDDRWPGEGPLGGVITALLDQDVDVVVAACDLPRLDASTVRQVLAAGQRPGVDVAVAVADGRHVSLARWNRSALEALEARFALGERSLRGVFDHLRTTAVEVDAAAVADVDTPADLRRIVVAGATSANASGEPGPS